jgi:hypothetical protein
MGRKNETFYYHIRWLGGGSTLDWDMWSTRAAAEYSARQIAQPGETSWFVSSDNLLLTGSPRFPRR